MKRLIVPIVLCLASVPSDARAEVVQPEDVLNTRYATSAVVSPDGAWVACTVSIARGATDAPGARYVELHLVSTGTGESRPFVQGAVNVGSVAWRPDGGSISFRMKRGDGDAVMQVWTIPVDGGEASAVTHSPTAVYAYAWHPDGRRIAYTAVRKDSPREKKLEKMGYDFVYFEEALRNRNIYMEDVQAETTRAEVLVDDVTAWDLVFSPDGHTLAFSASARNLVDERYLPHVYLYDLDAGGYHQFTDNPGKLGTFTFSPDGRSMAYTAALTVHDHDHSQLFVKSVAGGEARNLTPPDYRGHMEWAGWFNDGTVVYRASEGVWSRLWMVSAAGGRRTLILDGANLRYSVGNPRYTEGFKHVSFTGTSPDMPSDVFYWKGKGKPKRLTHLNPWVEERELGSCEVVTYAARDGYEVEGLLFRPVGYEAGTRYPLVVYVHGGPEAHESWAWRSAYQRPVEVLTGRGYVVFHPNYRGSTGYGLAHTEAHFGDPAGVEFDDIADGIRHLSRIGLVDSTRVGIVGGSYGGYAAAWFATYYTSLVRAAVVFVGISDVISKLGTGDIPWEERNVHMGAPLEEMWQTDLERSPIYWAHQSRTATLILGGQKDTRVHPGQSLELYRRMKMNGHPAVRLVQYPGEPHGNRRMPGRRDVLYRELQWFDWYVRDAKPLDGGMPDIDIGDDYPFSLPAKEDNAPAQSR